MYRILIKANITLSTKIVKIKKKHPGLAVNVLFKVINSWVPNAIELRSLKTVSSTFQDLDFDVPL